MLTCIHNEFRYGVEYLKCAADYGEKCNRSEYIVEETKSYLKILLEICDQGTHLHSGKQLFIFSLISIATAIKFLNSLLLNFFL